MKLLAHTFKLVFAVLLLMSITSQASYAQSNAAEDVGKKISPILYLLLLGDRPSEAPTIDTIDYDHIMVTGSGVPGATITLSVACDNSPLIVDGSGAWSCNMTAGAQSGGTQIDVSQTEVGETESDVVSTIVRGLSSAPVINQVGDSRTKITGTGVAGATITLSLTCDNQPVVVSQTGDWQCDISSSGAQSLGTVIDAVQTEPNSVDSTSVSTTVIELCEYDITAGQGQTNIASASFPIQDAGSNSTVDIFDDCISETRQEFDEHYSAYYHFTIDAVSDVRIAVQSTNGADPVDTYLIIYSGNTRSGSLYENDDHDSSHGFQGLSSTDAGLRIFNLPAGDYTVEATTSLGSQGSFKNGWTIDGDHTVSLELF